MQFFIQKTRVFSVSVVPANMWVENAIANLHSRFAFSLIWF